MQKHLLDGVTAHNNRIPKRDNKTQLKSNNFIKILVFSHKKFDIFIFYLLKIQKFLFNKIKFKGTCFKLRPRPTDKNWN
jgi:hypothetical protein